MSHMSLCSRVRDYIVFPPYLPIHTGNHSLIPTPHFHMPPPTHCITIWISSKRFFFPNDQMRCSTRSFTCKKGRQETEKQLSFVSLFPGCCFWFLCCCLLLFHMCLKCWCPNFQPWSSFPLSLYISSLVIPSTPMISVSAHKQ